MLFVTRSQNGQIILTRGSEQIVLTIAQIRPMARIVRVGIEAPREWAITDGQECPGHLPAGFTGGTRAAADSSKQRPRPCEPIRDR